jgi:hypothetical protein
MEPIKVKELMVPIERYASVSGEATLYEAIVALQEAQKSVEEGGDKFRAILVLDRNNRILGKVDMLDVLRGIEPRYRDLAYPRETSPYGFSPEFIRSMLQTYSLWRKPLDEICSKASGISIKEVMHPLNEGEYIEEGALLDEAIHQLVMGQSQSLLVTRGEEVVGILRLSDVFKEICNRIRSCRI